VTVHANEITEPAALTAHTAGLWTHEQRNEDMALPEPHAWGQQRPL